MQQFVLTGFMWKTYFYYRGLNTIVCMAIVRKGVEQIMIFFSKSFGANKINENIATCNKLSNNFADLVASGLGSLAASLNTLIKNKLRLQRFHLNI